MIGREFPLPPEVLSVLEARGIAFAGERYATGSAAYDGCKAGFMDGYLPGIPTRIIPDPTPDWNSGYLAGITLGLTAAARDRRDTFL